MITLYYFVSYSGDEYFMKSKNTEFNKFQANKFCEKYIPYEYEEWDVNSFKYNKFCIYTTESSYVKIPRSFGEYYLVNLDDIEEFDVAYFSDEYCPQTYDKNDNPL